MIRAALPLALLLTAVHPAVADLRVTTDIPVIEGLVADVMGETGAPDVMIPQGSDPHSHQMRPSEARALSNADVVVWLGPEMTPWMERVLEQSSEAPRVTLLEVPGTRLRTYDEEHDDHDHAEKHGHDEHGHDEHAHDDEHGHEDAHDHEGADPHAWLEPANARTWLRAIATALGAVDPDNAAVYSANAEAASSRIATLEATLKARLSSAATRPIVVFHDAYGYFEDAFGITVAGTIAEGDAAAPGAQRLVELRQTIERDGVVCLFREPQHSPALAERVAEETGAALGTLDPLGALVEPGPMFYDRVMTALADNILTCLDQGA